MNLLLDHKIISRCRPYLGTYVTISIQYTEHSMGLKAINAAFSAIERIHHLMSFHDAHSELSLINQHAFTKPQRMSADLTRVLQTAKMLYDASGGIFDVTIAPLLMETGVLPRHDEFSFRVHGKGRGCDIDISKEGWVCFQKPLCIDLGGIAKGYAVDQAIDVLQDLDIDGAVVNAGGDIRCFGKERHQIFVRHPKKKDHVVGVLDLKNEAIATSSTNERRDHVHGYSREIMEKPYSVSVVAKSCMIADALTKVVMAQEMQSERILAKFNAKAYMVYPDDNVVCIESGSH